MSEHPSAEAPPSFEGDAVPSALDKLRAGVAEFKKKNRANIRKRAAAEDSDKDGEDFGLVRKPKQQKDSALAFSTKQAGPSKLELFKHEGNRALQQSTDQGATRTLETETEFDRDARALREAVLRQGVEEGAAAEEGVYRGMKAYTDYRKGFRQEHTIASEKGSGAHGPLRASTNMRMTVRFDYQPDLCKDYKETGYCGYGDSCKFVHDRSDYKSGWELEREWQAQQKAKREAKWVEEAELDGGPPDPDSVDAGREDDLPFACYICRKPWAELEDPVVTHCKHYFCERCALRHNAKSRKCYVCGAATSGIFNAALDIEKRLKQQKTNRP
eukprot:jgi/Botrbrau1/6717/Bobra.0324s0008.1